MGGTSGDISRHNAHGWQRDVIYVLLVLECVVFPVLLVFFIYRYRRYRRYAALRKRHAELMILASMWVVPYFAIHRLFYLLTLGLGYNNTALVILRICTFQLFTVFPGNVHSLRMWKIHYDFKLVQLTSNEKWKRIIMSTGNPTVADNKSSHFYLRHQNTIGNLKWLFNFVIILSIVEGTLSGFASIYISEFGLSGTVNHFQTLLIFAINNLFNIIVWKITPTFDDCFFIKYEMQLLWSIYVGTMVLFLVWYGIGKFVHYNAFATFLFAENFAPVFIMATLFVILIWTVDFKLQSHGLLAVDDAYASMWETAEKSKPKNKNKKITKFFKAKKKNKNSINDIMALLTDDNGFEIFMEHLLHEFSSEALLSVVEIVQLKQLVKTKFGYVCTCDDSKESPADEALEDGTIQNIIHISKREHTTMTVSSWSGSGNSDQESISGMKIRTYPRVERYRLPSIVPESGVVFQEVDDFYVVIEALYKKYICAGATHEVNIGYDLRVIMEDRMAWIDELFHERHLSNEKKELKKWCYHIFDPVVEEMFTLMEDPFLRFSSTPVYKQWQKRTSA